MELVVIDHHTAKRDIVNGWSNVRIPSGNREQFMSSVEYYLEKTYDHVLTDQDPDGIMAASLYLLSADNKPETKTMRGGLTRDDIAQFKKDGIERILALDWYGIYDSDVSAVDRVVLLNPTYSGLSHNLCATQLVYEGTRSMIEENSRETALTLACMGIVSDYGVDEAKHIIGDLAKKHPHYFGDVMGMLKDGTLDRYSVFDTLFDRLSDMAWAPTVNLGDKGSEQLIKLISEHAPFTIDDLFGDPGKTTNPAATFLVEQYGSFKQMLDKEWRHFTTTARIDDRTIIFEPQSSSKGFVQKFSSKVADKNTDKIILVRTKLGEDEWKYSLRRRELDVDLGSLVKNMGVGGGIPPAAGCTVSDPDRFEDDFKKEIETALG